jgi:Flp pilus assembly protein TadG
MKTLLAALTRFKRNNKGGIALVAGLSALPLLVVAGVAVDFVNRNKYQEESQAAVDAAALAGAATKTSFDSILHKTLTGADAKKDGATKMLQANLTDRLKISSHSSQITIDDNKVKVDMTVTVPTAFMRLVGISTVSVKVTSLAARYDGRACLIALGANGNGIHLGGTTNVAAPGCWAYSNKTGSDSLYVGGSSKIATAGTCIVGTSTASLTSATPAPKKCVPLDDPMAKWTPPTTSWLCDHNNFKKSASAANKTIILTPGVYCGGLQANGFDTVTLQPGIYFIKDGKLDITSKLDLTGLKVGFYLSKSVTDVTINGSANVNLTADDQGPMAGLVIAMQPGSPSITTATINGTASLYLQGSVYLPTSDIALSGTSATILSPVTQLIGYSINLQGTSNLTFKADFDAGGLCHSRS